MNPNRRILIVDDEIRLAYQLARLFEGQGWSATTVCEGETAVRAVSEEEFTAVLLDIRMPGVDGFQTLAAILKVRPEQCVVYFTGYADVDTAVRGLRAGATSLIQKGSPFKEISAIVEKAVEHKAHERRAREIERLREADQLVLNLALGIAHQLKNDLNGIALGLDLLESDRDERRLTRIEEIRGILQHSDDTIRKLYHFRKTNSLDCVSVPARRVVDNAILQAMRRQKESTMQADIAIPEQTCVMCEELFLTEAIECLVENSLNANGGTARLVICCVQEYNSVVLRLMDDGPGFSSELLEVAHEPFRTSHSKTHIGFGLTFARAVVVGCGGSLTYGNRDDASGAIVEIALLSTKQPSPGEIP